jgi:hypothetical protein
MTGMSGWMIACVAPYTVTVNPSISNSPPAVTAVTWLACALKASASEGGAYNRRSGSAARAALIAASFTWSKCSCVSSTADAPEMMSAAFGENEPGSTTNEAPSFSKATQACSCLVSFTAMAPSVAGQTSKADSTADASGRREERAGWSEEPRTVQNIRLWP